jgi:hypothetical protein
VLGILGTGALDRIKTIEADARVKGLRQRQPWPLIVANAATVDGPKSRRRILLNRQAVTRPDESTRWDRMSAEFPARTELSSCRRWCVGGRRFMDVRGVWSVKVSLSRDCA